MASGGIASELAAEEARALAAADAKTRKEFAKYAEQEEAVVYASISGLWERWADTAPASMKALAWKFGRSPDIGDLSLCKFYEVEPDGEADGEGDDMVTVGVVQWSDRKRPTLHRAPATEGRKAGKGRKGQEEANEEGEAAATVGAPSSSSSSSSGLSGKMVGLGAVLRVQKDEDGVYEVRRVASYEAKRRFRWLADIEMIVAGWSLQRGPRMKEVLPGYVGRLMEIYEALADNAATLLRACDDCHDIISVHSRKGVATMCPLCRLILHPSCATAVMASKDKKVRRARKEYLKEKLPPKEVVRDVAALLGTRLCNMCGLWFAGRDPADATSSSSSDDSSSSSSSD